MLAFRPFPLSIASRPRELQGRLAPLAAAATRCPAGHLDVSHSGCLRLLKALGSGPGSSYAFAWRAGCCGGLRAFFICLLIERSSVAG